MADSYRVLTVEDEPDPTAYLRLVLLRTGAAAGTDRAPAEHPVHCPAGVRAILRGLTSRAGGASPGSGRHADMVPAAPITLILDEAPDRLEVLSAYFGDAGCAVIAVGDAEQALSLRPDVAPDLLVLPQPPPGGGDGGLDTLRERYPQCPVAVTSVLDPGDHHRAASPTTAAIAGTDPARKGQRRDHVPRPRESDLRAAAAPTAGRT